MERAQLDAIIREALDRSELAAAMRAAPVRRYVGDPGEPAFQGSWVNFDAGGHAASPPLARDAYFYRHRGRVWLGGVIRAGVSGTTAFTLPPGYRPLAQTGACGLIAEASGGHAEVDIFPDGTVRPANQTGNVNTHVFLDNLSFDHAP